MWIPCGIVISEHLFYLSTLLSLGFVSVYLYRKNLKGSCQYKNGEHQFSTFWVVVLYYPITPAHEARVPGNGHKHLDITINFNSAFRVHSEQKTEHVTLSFRFQLFASVCGSRRICGLS